MLKERFESPDLYRAYLPNTLKMDHPLCKLADQIDWDYLYETFKGYYSEDTGRPAKSIRLMVGLHYLKYMKNLSDEELVASWVENPYWQYFCGEEYFQIDFPIHPTSMTKWRNRIGVHELQKLLQTTIKAGLKSKTIQSKSFHKANVDTTVQEKNIAFPIDIRLYYRLIAHLVRFAKRCGIKLKQTFIRVGCKLLRRYSGYSHARQMKRAAKVQRKMKTNLGRLYRSILQVVPADHPERPAFDALSELVLRAMKQTRKGKNKLYSVHEPHVECICKGKAHKRYEFGCKVGFVSTSKEGFILSATAFHGNPYDGHTLQQTLDLADANIEGTGKLADVYADLGYRGHDYNGDAQVHIVGRKRKSLTRSQIKWFNRRAAIEANIGHMKNDHRLDRNYLSGKSGDMFNAVLSACGYNLRMIYRHIVSIFFVFLQIPLFLGHFRRNLALKCT